jgi:transcriptional regulator with XRE-family HTH domain
VTLLKHIRIRLDLSARELGTLAGVHQPLVSLIESGRLRPTPEQLDALARALHVDPPAALLEEVQLIDRQRIVAEQAVTA